MFFSKRSGLRYVQGTSQSYAFTLGDFTTDETWRALDISSFVPANAKLVHFRVGFGTNAAQSQFIIAPPGSTNSNRGVMFRTILGNIPHHASGFCACTGQAVAYYAANHAWSWIDVTILGWFI